MNNFNKVKDKIVKLLDRDGDGELTLKDIPAGLAQGGKLVKDNPGKSAALLLAAAATGGAGAAYLAYTAPWYAGPLTAATGAWSAAAGALGFGSSLALGSSLTATAAVNAYWTTAFATGSYGAAAAAAVGVTSAGMAITGGAAVLLGGGLAYGTMALSSALLANAIASGLFVAGSVAVGVAAVYAVSYGFCETNKPVSAVIDHSAGFSI